MARNGFICMNDCFLYVKLTILFLYFIFLSIVSSCSRSHSNTSSIENYIRKCENSNSKIKSQSFILTYLGDGKMNETVTYYLNPNCEGEYLSMERYLNISGVTGSLEDSFREKKEATFTPNIHADGTFMILKGNMADVRGFNFLVACEYNSDEKDYPIKRDTNCAKNFTKANLTQTLFYDSKSKTLNLCEIEDPFECIKFIKE